MYTPIFTLADSEFVIPIPGLMFAKGSDATDTVEVVEDLLGITWTGKWKRLEPGEDFEHVNIRIAGSTNVAVISGDLFDGTKREFDGKPTNYQRLVALAETNAVIDNAMVGGGETERTCCIGSSSRWRTSTTARMRNSSNSLARSGR